MHRKYPYDFYQLHAFAKSIDSGSHLHCPRWLYVPTSFRARQNHEQHYMRDMSPEYLPTNERQATVLHLVDA